jgi:hypothetical protein
MTTGITYLKCFVIAFPQDRRFEQLYQEIYDVAIRDVAIRDAQLIPCRTMFETDAKLPIETIVQDIGSCDACFADLSQESAYQWFAIGCALAMGKPLCVVSSKDENNAPFALPQPGAIRYPLHSLPSDYKRLKNCITSRLQVALSQMAAMRGEIKVDVAVKVCETTTAIQPQVIEGDSSSDESLIAEVLLQMAEVTTAEGLIVPLALNVGDVRVHELLALAIILERGNVEGITLRELALEMNKHGVAQATSLSIHGLCRKRLVERRLISNSNGQQSYNEERLFISAAGEAWIEANRRSLDLSFTPPPPDVEPLGLMEYLASI